MRRLRLFGPEGVPMRTTAFLKRAEREAQFVEALLARYALTVYHGMTVLGDENNASVLGETVAAGFLAKVVERAFFRRQCLHYLPSELSLDALVFPAPRYEGPFS